MELEEVIQSLEDMLNIEDGYCTSSMDDNQIVIEADKGALIELAWHLLKMAKKDHFDGMHQHFDETNFLDEPSVPIIVVRKDATELE